MIQSDKVKKPNGFIRPEFFFSKIGSELQGEKWKKLPACLDCIPQNVGYQLYKFLSQIRQGNKFLILTS